MICAVIRPYPLAIRNQVFLFLQELGYQLGTDLVCEPGTPDARAAEWAGEHDMDLLVLPYHVHQATDGKIVDGIGVALLLPSGFTRRDIPILMPVDDNSPSFDRRLDDLYRARPDVASRIIVMKTSEIGSEQVRERLSAFAAQGAGQ